MSEVRPALRVAALRKEYQTPAEALVVLDGVSFELRAGEALAIMGPSGSGKSTLLHILGALDRPTAGSVEVAGIDPFSLGERELARFRNRRIGFVFQDHYLLPQLTVLENVLVPTIVAEGAAAGSVERARELLDRVGLARRLGHLPAELSGGERQRAAIARALINAPEAVLCDEPTGNLDAATAAAVSDLFLDLHAREKNVLVVATHSADLAARLGRRFDLRAGRLEPAAAGAGGKR